MATYSTSLVITEVTPNTGIKRITVTTPTPGKVYTGDSMTLTLTDYGISISGLLSITGWIHSDDSGVVVKEAPTTSVATTGVLTITVGGSAATGRRTYSILGKGN